MDGNGEIALLRSENERLSQQIQVIRQEYEAKIERLNARLRDQSGSTPSPTATPEERRGFFRR